MNLLLIRAGYPPIAIGPEERAAYLATLEDASVSGDRAGYRQFMDERLEAALRAHIDAFRESATARPEGVASAPRSPNG